MQTGKLECCREARSYVQAKEVNPSGHYSTHDRASPKKGSEPVFRPSCAHTFDLAHGLSLAWTPMVFAYFLAQSCCVEYMNLLEVRQGRGLKPSSDTYKLNNQ